MPIYLFQAIERFSASDLIHAICYPRKLALTTFKKSIQTITMTTLYGIKNCDTVRKAMKWLQANNIHFNYHDFRVDGISQEKINEWLKVLGNEKVVNKRSTAWKTLSQVQKEHVMGEDAADILTQIPTLIKRPVLEHKSDVLLGFKDSDYQEQCANTAKTSL